jgi:hypothetical protein
VAIFCSSDRSTIDTGHSLNSSSRSSFAVAVIRRRQPTPGSGSQLNGRMRNLRAYAHDPLQTEAISRTNDRSAQGAGVHRPVVKIGEGSGRSSVPAGDADEVAAQQPLAIGATVHSRPYIAGQLWATNAPYLIDDKSSWQVAA